MFKLAATLLLTTAISVSAQQPPEVWVPKIEFSLEDSSFKETMLWVSGWAYALTEMGKASAKSGRKGPICLPPSGYVESRVLVDILNTRFKGLRVSSEEASTALWLGATKYYSCGGV